jgi:hypothetical protein
VVIAEKVGSRAVWVRADVGVVKVQEQFVDSLLEGRARFVTKPFEPRVWNNDAIFPHYIGGLRG